jgi:CMP-N-acetylneuraminic acid synthetase
MVAAAHAGEPALVILIPARGGSLRIPGKNIRRLGDHPLIAYTIAAARESALTSAVIVSTDSEEIARVARHYGAEVPFLRPAEFAGPRSPDIEWVEYTLGRLADEGRRFDCFSILRPTSPFRQADTIQRAWRAFVRETGVDSLRAVEKCRQHPGKMWIVRGARMTPLLPLGPPEQPWHSSQYQSLPEVYVQNASLEIAWSRVVSEGRSIAGHVLMPFLTEGFEGFDLNDRDDWIVAEHLVSSGEAVLPKVTAPPYRDEAAVAPRGR